jgi:hypothetical protein
MRVRLMSSSDPVPQMMRDGSSPYCRPIASRNAVAEPSG